MTADYIIVGAGSAGCVLADRLSANGKHRILLLEAGPSDTGLFITMPKGFGMLLDPKVKQTWAIPASGDSSVPPENWWRGRTLGGSSSINGLVYLRGRSADYDGWERNGASGWGWSEIRRAFDAIEGGPDNHGPLRISRAMPSEICDRVIEAGKALGLDHLHGSEQPGEPGIGYVGRNIHKGRRESAADLFLHPAMARPNLTVQTNAHVDRILFDGQRAGGVRLADGREFHTAGEVILCAGSIHSPQILQRSGIGPAPLLQRLGINVLVDSPGVGEHMIEHRLLTMHYRLNRRLGINKSLRGAGAIGSALRYLLLRNGPLAEGSCDVAAFIRTRPGLRHPDAQLLMSPFGYAIDAGGKAVVANFDSFHIFGYPLGCRSEGSIRISSRDPLAPADIDANYFADAYDRDVTVALFRFIRALVATPPLAEVCAEEVSPGPSVSSDEDILQAFREKGHCGLHACGTVRMGSGSDDPLDPQLRVRGTSGLRVVDASIFPSALSSNPNGPTMAVAWRAAEILQQTAAWR